MMKFEREYYPLPLTAAILDCSVADLIHWAANGKIRLGILCHVDASTPQDYRWIDDQDVEIAPVDFQGFAYLNTFYFAHFERRGELAFNAVEMQDGDWVQFLDEMHIISSAEQVFMHQRDLLTLMRNTGPDATETDKKETLPTRVRDTLLKIIIGMAIKGYNYNPLALKSKVPNEISTDLAALGISVSDDTIREYLKESAQTVLPAMSHPSNK